MAGKMDKKNVKLSFEPLASVKWDQVTQISGKGVPQLCKTTVKEVLAGVKAKKYKKPYGKVGLIGKDMWFRIKDGSTHIDDILLVKNWSMPAGTAVELTSQQQQGLKAWILTRQGLLKTCSDGVDAAQPLFRALQNKCDRLETYLDLAKNGSTETITGTGIEANVDKAKELLKDIQTTAAGIKQIHDRDVYPVYSTHRTVKSPDSSLGLPQETYDEYAAKFYLQTVGPHFKKLDGYVKQSAALFEAAQKQYLLIVKWSSKAASALDNYKDEAQNLLDQMTEEFTKIKAEEGMSPFSNLENGLSSDTRNISTYAPNLLDRLFDNATGKITKAKETMKRILKRQTTVDQQLKKMKAIPKNILGSNDVKPFLVQTLTLHKEVTAYVKQQKTYLAAGAKQFLKLKKEYEKKVQ